MVNVLVITSSSFSTPCFSSLPQLPRTITWNESQYVYMLPTEVAGWLLRAVDVNEGSWVLLMSPDVTLACGLAQRGPIGLNVTVGLTHLNVANMEEVKAAVPVVISKVKTICRLHRIRWGGQSAHCAPGGKAPHTLWVSTDHEWDGPLPLWTCPPPCVRLSAD